MNKILITGIFLVFMVNTANAEYATGFIDDLAVTPEGVYVKLKGIPFPNTVGCTNSNEALLPNNIDNYQIMYSMLLTMYIKAKLTKLWISECTVNNIIGKISTVRDGRYPTY